MGKRKNLKTLFTFLKYRIDMIGLMTFSEKTGRSGAAFVFHCGLKEGRLL